MIPLSRPNVGASELEAISAVLESAWLGEGQVVRDFENWLAEYTDCEQVIAVGTGTAALHLALLAAGVGEGDEVIMPSFTYVADAMAVLMCGATPVFGDIDNHTLNLDPACLPGLLTSRTRAVMPTDYSGLPADSAGIRQALNGHEARIIRDGCHSFGSTVNGKRLGLMDEDDLACFSFDPIKNITCGEGGAILCRDKDMAEQLRSLRRLGLSDSTWDGFKKNSVVASMVTQVGYRYHMSNLNASIGLAQSRRAEELIERRKQAARLYDECLAGTPNLELLSRDYDEICPFMYVVRVKSGLREGLIDHLANKKIHSGLRYIPCHVHPLFRDQGRPPLPVTELVATEALSIPLFFDIQNEDIHRIAEEIGRYLEQH